MIDLWSEQTEKLLFMLTIPFEPAMCEVSSIYTFEKRNLKEILRKQITFFNTLEVFK